jgi:hypothetical protein
MRSKGASQRLTKIMKRKKIQKIEQEIDIHKMSHVKSKNETSLHC